MAEIENAISAFYASNCCDNVDFPALEGDDRMISKLCLGALAGVARPSDMPVPSFDILDLLAHLVDHRF